MDEMFDDTFFVITARVKEDNGFLLLKPITPSYVSNAWMKMFGADNQTKEPIPKEYQVFKFDVEDDARNYMLENRKAWDNTFRQNISQLRMIYDVCAIEPKTNDQRTQ